MIERLLTKARERAGKRWLDAWTARRRHERSELLWVRIAEATLGVELAPWQRRHVAAVLAGTRHARPAGRHSGRADVRVLAEARRARTEALDGRLSIVADAIKQVGTAFAIRDELVLRWPQETALNSAEGEDR